MFKSLFVCLFVFPEHNSKTVYSVLMWSCFFKNLFLLYAVCFSLSVWYIELLIVLWPVCVECSIVKCPYMANCMYGKQTEQSTNIGNSPKIAELNKMPWMMAVEPVYMCVKGIWYQLLITHVTDELATWIATGNVAGWKASDLGLFWHDSCEYEYEVWPGVRDMSPGANPERS